MKLKLDLAEILTSLNKMAEENLPINFEKSGIDHPKRIVYKVGETYRVEIVHPLINNELKEVIELKSKKFASEDKAITEYKKAINGSLGTYIINKFNEKFPEKELKYIDIKSFPNVEVKLLTEEKDVKDWIVKHITGNGGTKEVGFDMEWTQDFKLQLIQLAVIKTYSKDFPTNCNGYVALIKIKNKFIPSKLRSLFNSSKVAKYGIATHYDIRQLRNFGKPNNVIDVISYFTHLGVSSSCGAKRLLYWTYGWNINKDINLKTFDWSSELEEEQINYAALDALLPILVHYRENR